MAPHSSAEPQPTYLLTLYPVREGMPEGPTEFEAETVGKHFDRFKRLTDEGKIIMVGRTAQAPYVGLAIFYARDNEDAERFLSEDPAVEAKVMSGKVELFKLVLLSGH